MTANEWLGCELLGSDPEMVSGAIVFKRQDGKLTRLPLSAILENVDSYMDEGFTLEQAISETLDSFPSVPGGADSIRAVLAYREAHEPQHTF